jgi:hypothetical protein
MRHTPQLPLPTSPLVAQNRVVDSVLDSLLHAVRDVKGVHVHIVCQRLRRLRAEGAKLECQLMRVEVGGVLLEERVGHTRCRGREQKHRAQEKEAVHHRGRGWEGRGCGSLWAMSMNSVLVCVCTRARGATLSGADPTAHARRSHYEISAALAAESANEMNIVGNFLPLLVVEVGVRLY